MNISYKQSQFELFPGSPGSSSEAGRPRYAFANVTLSLENIISIGILSVLVMVACFSFGVERGKKIVTSPSRERDSRSATAKSGKAEAGRLPAAEARQPEESAGISSSPAQNQPPIPAQEGNPQAEQLQEIPENVYTIQVASYKKEKHAQKEAITLKQKGFDIYVLPKGDYSILCVGKFSEKSDAKVFAKQLKKQYKDYIIRRL